jgi:hypothetical protein
MIYISEFFSFSIGELQLCLDGSVSHFLSLVVAHWDQTDPFPSSSGTHEVVPSIHYLLEYGWSCSILNYNLIILGGVDISTMSANNKLLINQGIIYVASHICKSVYTLIYIRVQMTNFWSYNVYCLWRDWRVK